VEGIRKMYAKSKPASDYFDRPCGSHVQFEQIKAELEGQGFKYVGNSTTHEPLYHQHLKLQEHHYDFRMAQARQQQHFTNEVEERTWEFRDRGYQVVRTQGFKVDGMECAL
jgi:hypothetical protein